MDPLFFIQGGFMKSINYDYSQTGKYKAEQDVSAYLDYAQESRAIGRSAFDNQRTGYRSLAIVPDIVAVDILNRFGYDIHSSENDQSILSKIANIIKTHYPNLLTSSMINSVTRR